MRIAHRRTTPIASAGFRQRIFEALCLVLVAACCLAVAWMQQRGDDLLELERGAVVLSASSEYDSWPALALVDGSAATGWASRRGRPAPNTLVIELPQRHELESIVIDNTRSQEIDYPGISARRIEIWGSTASADAGFRRLGVIEATQGGREDFPLPPGSRAQWLKLEVTSNWGNEDFTEIMELEAYGRPLGEPAAPPAIGGTFATNFGRLYLEREGARVRGCYDRGEATVSGSLAGRSLRVRWRETDASGRAVLAVSAGGDYLTGLWYDGGELRGVWRGHRDATGEPPCRIDPAEWAEN